MKCPLFVMARLMAGAPQDTKLVYCLKEECAGWNSNTDKCSVYSGSLLLARLCEHLGHLVDKMPHEEQFRR